MCMWFKETWKKMIHFMRTKWFVLGYILVYLFYILSWLPCISSFDSFLYEILFFISVPFIHVCFAFGLSGMFLASEKLNIWYYLFFQSFYVIFPLLLLIQHPNSLDIKTLRLFLPVISTTTFTIMLFIRNKMFKGVKSIHFKYLQHTNLVLTTFFTLVSSMIAFIVKSEIKLCGIETFFAKLEMDIFLGLIFVSPLLLLYAVWGLILQEKEDEEKDSGCQSPQSA